jgi:hypothetical protein
MEDGISIDCRRLVGLSVASLIGCDSMKSRSGQRWQLVAPRVPTLREAMQQNDQRTLSGFHDVHADAVCLDRSVHERNALAMAILTVTSGLSAQLDSTDCSQ